MVLIERRGLGQLTEAAAAQVIGVTEVTTISMSKRRARRSGSPIAPPLLRKGARRAEFADTSSTRCHRHA